MYDIINNIVNNINKLKENENISFIVDKKKYNKLLLSVKKGLLILKCSCDKPRF